MVVAVVTGASSGIGAALCRLLAGKGMKVAMVARRTEVMEKIQEQIVNTGGKAAVFTTDISEKEQVKSMASSVLSQLGTPSLLVNNAGVGLPGDLVFGNIHNSWDQTINVNIRGNLYVTGEFLPAIVSQGSGHIINMTAVAEKQTYPGLALFTGANHFWGGVADSLRKEIALYPGCGVRVTNIQPEITNSEMVTKTITALEMKGVDMEILKREMGNMLQIEDVADAVWDAYNSKEYKTEVLMKDKWLYESLDPALTKSWFDTLLATN